MLLTLAKYLIWKPSIWLVSTLITNLFVVFALTLAWRTYKTVLVRKVDLLRNRHWKQADGRQVVLITGASSGIGLAVAKHLYKIGYTVVATHYGTTDAGVTELKQLASSGNKQQQGSGNNKSTTKPQLIVRELDITDSAQVKQIYDELVKLLEQNNLYLYALINNAGLGSLQPFAWLQRKTIRRIIDTNLGGSLQLTRELLPLLAKSKPHGGSRILWVSSGLGIVPGATYATYGLTKAAQVYFSRCMNLELKSNHGIQSVAVIPHNFIKNTNICAENVRNNKLAWDELKPIERELYAREYKQHVNLSESLEQATKEHLKVAAQKVKLAREQQAVWWRKIVKFVSDIIACLTGENTTPTIEQSGTPECFEDALRLRDPPELIFAGDANFQLIVGSLLLSLPNSCMGLLSSSVSPSLYR